MMQEIITGLLRVGPAGAWLMRQYAGGTSGTLRWRPKCGCASPFSGQSTARRARRSARGAPVSPKVEVEYGTPRLLAVDRPYSGLAHRSVSFAPPYPAYHGRDAADRGFVRGEHHTAILH